MLLLSFKTHPYKVLQQTTNSFYTSYLTYLAYWHEHIFLQIFFSKIQDESNHVKLEYKLVFYTWRIVIITCANMIHYLVILSLAIIGIFVACV